MRRIAGTLALVALSFSLAESVWASTCAPSMSMEHTAATVDSNLPVQERCAQAVSVDDDAERSQRHCPFDCPLAAQACTGIVSMPGTGVPVMLAGSERMDSVFTVPSGAALLLESALFRPPRA